MFVRRLSTAPFQMRTSFAMMNTTEQQRDQPADEAREPSHRRLFRRPTFRNSDGHDHDERHATWFELFFDLVFVAAIAQLTSAFLAEPNLAGLGRFVALFVPVWWVWMTLTFYLDRFDTDDLGHRAIVLTAMVLAVALAADVPRAFTGDVRPFVLTFVVLRSLQFGLDVHVRHFVPAVRALDRAGVPLSIVVVAAWLVALSLPGAWVYLLFGPALAVDIVRTRLSQRARALPVNPAHLTERFGTFLLIVLGESMVQLVGATTRHPWSVAAAVVFVSAFTTITILWWMSFNGLQEITSGDDPQAVNRFAATQSVMVGSLAAASAGLSVAVVAATGGGTIELAPRVALYGGVAVYLVAAASSVPRSRRPYAVVTRALGAVASAGLVYMGAVVQPVLLVPSHTIILVGAVAVEGLLNRSALAGEGIPRRGRALVDWFGARVDRFGDALAAPPAGVPDALPVVRDYPIARPQRSSRR
jgi:low temperature requirement protein LtrA